MKVVGIVTVLLFILAGQAFAAEPAEINLRDGSVIRAEVISLQDGLYTLKSETLGTIVIEKSQISSIKMGTGDPARARQHPLLDNAECSPADVGAQYHCTDKHHA